MDPPPFFRDIWSRKTSETLFVFVIFSISCLLFFNIVSNPNRRFPSKNQFRDYHAWNRIEKSMPQHYTNFLKLLKLYETRSTCFQTLTFCRNLSFEKPWICQWIFHGFPTPWIFGEAAGAADKKQDWTPRPVLKGLSPVTNLCGLSRVITCFFYFCTNAERNRRTKGQLNT